MKWKDEAEHLDAALRGAENAKPEVAGLVKTARLVSSISQVPPLSPQTLGSARQAFLSQAALMGAEARRNAQAPQKETWLSRIKDALQPAGGRAFVPAAALLALVILCTLILGLHSLNRAAQTSLPGDTLYGIKLMQESLRKSLTFDPYEKVLLFTELVTERNSEISQLAESGQPIPIETVIRFENHLEDALAAACQLPDDELQTGLEEIRKVSNSAAEYVIQAGLWTQDAASRQILNQAASTAFNISSLADLGLRDPSAFRMSMAATLTVERPTATSTVKAVYPPVEPTPVVRFPTPTLGVFNPPVIQPTPTCTCTPTSPAQATQVPSKTPTDKPQPSNTATEPPPVLPTPTDIMIMPTQVTPTPTPTNTPDASGPGFPTPTPVMQDGE
jgi:hypothetical protein